MLILDHVTFENIGKATTGAALVGSGLVCAGLCCGIGASALNCAGLGNDAHPSGENAAPSGSGESVQAARDAVIADRALDVMEGIIDGHHPDASPNAYPAASCSDLNVAYQAANAYRTAGHTVPSDLKITCAQSAYPAAARVLPGHTVDLGYGYTSLSTPCQTAVVQTAIHCINTPGDCVKGNEVYPQPYGTAQQKIFKDTTCKQ